MTEQNPPTAEWRAIIVGDPSELRSLAAIIGEGAEVHVGLDDVSGAYLAGPFLDDLGDGGAVRARAQDLVDIISGAVRGRMRLREPLRVVSVARVHASGQRDAWAFAEDALGFTDDADAVVTRDGKIIGPAPPSLHERIRLERDDALVRDVLYWHGRVPATSYTMWKVFELIRQDAGGSAAALAATGWISATDINRVRQALNDQRILGRAARHAAVKSDPIVEPRLTLREAEDLVRSLTERWLTERQRRT